MTGKEEEWQEKMTAVNEAKEREMAILLEKVSRNTYTYNV